MRLNYVKIRTVFTPFFVGVALIAMSFLLANLNPNTATATDTTYPIAESCDDAIGKFVINGTINAPAGTYDVFVHLSRRGEQAVVKLLHCQDDKDLTKLATVKASGDRWVNAGTIRPAKAGLHRFLFEQSAGEGDTTANRSSVMLVPHDNPPCIPDVQCAVTINGQEGYINPVGSLLNQEVLHVVRVQNVSNQKIVEVRYYVDSELAYTTKSLEPFDLRYAIAPDQPLTRVVRYASGQEVVLPGTVPSGYRMNLWNFFGTLATRQPLTVAAFSIAIGIPILIFMNVIVSILADKQRARRQYASASKRTPTSSWVLNLWQNLVLTIRKLKIAWVTLFIVSVLTSVWVGATTYVFDIFTVNGVSMNKNYYTDDKLLINKLPITLASMTGHEYLPERGDVVVARAVFGNTGTLTTHPGYIVKRVIGLPGERVLIRGGTVTIFNKDNPDGFNPFTGDWTKNIVPNPPSEYLDLTLSRSELFLTGDNRPESIDSRANGPIEVREVVGYVAAKVHSAHNINEPTGR